MLELDSEAAPKSSVPAPPRLFPPALMPILRERLGDAHPSLAGVGDELLEELLTSVFFAGLRTHEGSYFPVQVAFAGRLNADIVLPEGEATDGTPMVVYRWSTVRFDPARSFSSTELLRLGVATRGGRLYTKVDVCEGGLRIAGLAREGVNQSGDPYLKVISPRPGVLSLRRGAEHLLEYEHGRVGRRPPDPVLGQGVVRRALEASAKNAGLGNEAVNDYLNTVRSLVREMASHGRGGILVVSREAEPALPPGASYRTHDGTTLGQLLHYLDGASDARRATSPGSLNKATQQLRRVLKSAFTSETERLVAQVGGFTSMDGATVLDCALGLRGFGVVLPVAREIEALEALDLEAQMVHPYALSTRGTRHRAAITYASRFPGNVVFIASHDGPVSAAVRDERREHVLVFRLGSAQVY